MSITKTPASMIDPSGATNGQVLTFNGSTNTWVASAAPILDVLTLDNMHYPNVTNNIYVSLVSAGILPTISALSAANENVYAVGMYKKLTTGNWTVPAAVKKIRVFSIGGNGGIGGSKACTANNAGVAWGGGGGGGGMAIRDVLVTSGDVYTITNGVNGNNGAMNTSGTSGTSSSFSGNGLTVTGLGGNVGGDAPQGVCSDNIGGAGGVGGSASGGQVNVSGTNGTAGTSAPAGGSAIYGTTGNNRSIELMNSLTVGVTIQILEINNQIAQNISF